VIPLRWENRTIQGAHGLDAERLLRVLDEGGRVVVLEMVVGLGLGYFRDRTMHLVRPGERPPRAPTVVTLMLGWIGLGIIFLPGALATNLGGGDDITEPLREALRARVEVERAAKLALAAAAPESDADLTSEERGARAMTSLRVNDVDEAWRLAAAEIARAGGPLRQDWTLLRRLTIALHDAKQWDRAYAVATIVAHEFADQARKGYLANVIRRVERERGVPHALIPPPPFWQTSRGGLTLLAGAVSVLLALAGLTNEWTRTHRTLHVVNGTSREVTVEVEGASPATLDVPPGARRRVVVAEGERTVRARRGDIARVQTISLSTSYLQRFGRTTFVLDVEGAALLAKETVAYVGRDGTEPALPAPEVHFGELVYRFDGLDREFEDFEREVKLREHEHVRLATRVVTIDGPPEDIVDLIPDPTGMRALDFLELHARLAPAEARLLARYVEAAFVTGQHGRAEAFLQAGLGPDSPPAWLLEAYRLRMMAGETEEALLAEVVTALDTAQPRSRPTLLAVAARLTADGHASAARLEEARALAPDHPVVRLCEAEARLRVGDAPGARTHLARAIEGLDRREAALQLARFGLAGDAYVVSAFERRRVTRRTFGIDVYAFAEAEGLRDGRGAIEGVSHLSAVVSTEAEWGRAVRLACAIAREDPLPLEQTGEPWPLLIACNLRGDPRAALDAATKLGPEPFALRDITIMATLARLAGDDAPAREAMALARDAWVTAGPRGRPVALLLDDPTLATRDALRRVTVAPDACAAARLLAASLLPPGEQRAALLADVPIYAPRTYPSCALRRLRETLSR
jgi:hypothetical protein